MSRRGRTMRASWTRRLPVNSVDQAKSTKISEAEKAQSGFGPAGTGVTRTSRRERRDAPSAGSNRRADRNAELGPELAVDEREKPVFDPGGIGEQMIMRKRANGVPTMIRNSSADAFPSSLPFFNLPFRSSRDKKPQVRSITWRYGLRSVSVLGFR